jgi:hypothetical protein
MKISHIWMKIIHEKYNLSPLEFKLQRKKFHCQSG